MAQSSLTYNGKPLRLISPILGDFPWYSTTLCCCENLSEVGDDSAPFQTFAHCLQRYESTLFNRFSANELVVSLQNNLGIDFSGSSNMNKKDLTASEWTKICSIISAYRLLDVVAMLGGADRAPSVERRSMQHINANFRGMDKLADWPEVLKQFQKMLEKSGKKIESSSRPQAVRAPIRLLRMIARNDMMKNYTAIEANMLYAAMHIACMKDLRFSVETCPDLPESIDGLVRKMSLSAQEHEDLEDLRTLFTKTPKAQGSSDGVSYLRAPLQLALLISPIYLLLPLNLFKKSYNRHTMISISTCLGNYKPQVLVDVEKAIWNTLFSLASGTLDPLDLLQRLSDNLPWDLIHSASSTESVRTWFSLAAASPIPPLSAQNISKRPAAPTFADSLASAINGTLQSSATRLTPSQRPPSPSSSEPTVPPCNDPVEPQESTAMQDGHGKEHPSPLALHNGEDHHDMDLGDELNMEGGVDENQMDRVVGSANGDDDMEISDEDTHAPQCVAHVVKSSNRCRTLARVVGSVNSDNDREISDDSMHAPPLVVRSSNKRKTRAITRNTLPRESLSIKRITKRRRLASSDSENDSDDTFPPPISHGTHEEPIDVDLYTSLWEPITIKEFVKVENLSFEKKDVLSRFKCDIELRAFDGEGVEHRFTPEFHYDDCNSRLKEFFHRIEAGYLDGKPLHVIDPVKSGFDIISFADFQGLSPPALQARLRHKNLVVTGCPHPSMKFDKAGLRTLGPLDSQVSIQDHSIREGDSLMPTTVTGIVSDILENATPDGKILNGLEFPLWKDLQWDRCSYATDLVAWDYLRGKPHCGTLTTPYPTEHMRWGLAGTANAVTFLHIDSDGFATFVQVMCGKKVWGIYRPSPDLPLSSVNAFLDDTRFQLDTIPEQATFDLEAVVLRPGDFLLMQPGVPHFVYGPEHTITYGGHFYSSCLMQMTVESLIHSFVASDFITNTSHHPSRQLLRRIVLFYGLGLVENSLSPQDAEFLHLPDVRTVDGLLDLISACTLVILGNVLDFRTYSAPNQGETEEATKAQQQLMIDFDRNNIPGNERMAICYARGVALAVFHWIRSCCIVKTPNGDALDDLPAMHMVQILNTLLAYKKKAMDQDIVGAPHCDIGMLRTQIENVVRCDGLIEKVWTGRKAIPADSLRLDLDKLCTIEWKKGATSPRPGEYQKLGMTPLDLKFMEGEQHRSQIEEQAAKMRKS